MQLPGGLVENGTTLRDWAFRPLSGALELNLAEVADEALDMPEAVNRALALALSTLAGAAATRERVAALCVADRQFLMRELERHLGFDGGWFQARCGVCDACFDFRLDYAELPVQEASDGYPLADVEYDGCRHTFRLPVGADQTALLQLPQAEARPWLVRQLAAEPERLGELTDDFVAAVEAALESVAPAVVERVQAACPECGAANDVELDPYRALSRSDGGLLQEIHQLAMHYHWPEADILELPRMRRQRYLRLIDQARGMAV